MQPSRPLAQLRRYCMLVPILAMLTGCYLPVKFDAEVVLERNGDYDMIFDGYLVALNLYRGLQDGTMLPAAEKEEIDKVLADFERDVSAQKYKYMNNGIFHLNWRNKGNLGRSKTVAFLRRNQNFLSLSLNQEAGTITLLGTPVSDVNAQRVLDLGLNMQGELRFITDLPVAGQNATRTYQSKNFPGKTVYVWKLQSIQDPTPTLKIGSN